MGPHVVMMDMTKVGSINGVARCIMTLSEGLSRNHAIYVTWIRFVHGCQSCQNNEINSRQRIIQIPLPNDISSFLANGKIREKYWAEAYNRLLHVLKDSTILHVHTLNLMEFALLVKKHTNSKIVTHLHCIPWKGLYNTNVELFNSLYYKYYIQKDYSHPEQFIRQKHELLSYTKSDCVICVTDCAKEFINNVCPNHTTNIRVIVNGINDWKLTRKRKNNNKGIKIIFVGSPQNSKGLSFVLAAMQASLMRARTSLLVVGNYSNEIRNIIVNQYPFIDIEFAGKVGIEQLKVLYANSDMGIIGSIQEQCSYVAIEMMMNGLPVITTDVDGLGEIFIQNYNGVVVKTHFSTLDGLQPEITSMADAIVELCSNVKLRRKIGQNGRSLYEQKYTLTKMASEINKIYANL